MNDYSLPGLLQLLEAYADTLPAEVRSMRKRGHLSEVAETRRAIANSVGRADVPRFTITRNLAGEYEVRTLLGDVGRGDDLDDAVYELLCGLEIIRQRPARVAAAA